MSLKNIIESDIDIFYDLEDFATPAIYKGKSISILFSKDYEVEGIADVVITIRKSEVPNLKKKEVLNINSLDYKVIAIDTDPENDLEYIVMLNKQ